MATDLLMEINGKIKEHIKNCFSFLLSIVTDGIFKTVLCIEAVTDGDPMNRLVGKQMVHERYWTF